jgi:hypothetical protein
MCSSDKLMQERGLNIGGRLDPASPLDRNQAFEGCDQTRGLATSVNGRAGGEVRRSSLFVSHGCHMETNGMLMLTPRPDDCDRVWYQNLHVPPIIIRHRIGGCATYCPIGWSEVDMRRDDKQGAHAAETASDCRCRLLAVFTDR